MISGGKYACRLDRAKLTENPVSTQLARQERRDNHITAISYSINQITARQVCCFCKAPPHNIPSRKHRVDLHYLHHNIHGVAFSENKGLPHYAFGNLEICLDF
eukprot:scaffold5896_cov155-Amphora_coffeaeformis.AAC.1